MSVYGHRTGRAAAVEPQLWQERLTGDEKAVADDDLHGTELCSGAVWRVVWLYRADCPAV